MLHGARDLATLFGEEGDPSFGYSMPRFPSPRSLRVKPPGFIGTTKAMRRPSRRHDRDCRQGHYAYSKIPLGTSSGNPDS